MNKVQSHSKKKKKEERETIKLMRVFACFDHSQCGGEDYKQLYN